MEKIKNVMKYIKEEYAKHSVYLKDEIDFGNGEKVTHIYKIIRFNDESFFGIRIISSDDLNEVGTFEFDTKYFEKCGPVHTFYSMTEEEFNIEFQNICDYLKNLE